MSSSPEPEDEVIVVEDDRLGGRSRVHCEATWKIKNFSCCQLECGEEMFSPLLSADSSGKFKLYLSIFPNGQAEFEEYVSIYVVFTHSGETPVDGFRASCKVAIIDSESNVWICDRIDQNLSRFQFNTFVRRERLLAAKDTVIPQDTLTIRCQICVFDPRMPETEPGSSGDVPPVAESPRTFADDFKKLYESQKFTDVTLETRDGTISAHKVILSARSSVFAEQFREPRATYPLPKFDKYTTGTLMAYIYSGRTEPEAPTVLFDLYELAQIYRLRELTTVLAPNQISVQTEVTNEAFSYTWRVPNFSSIDTETQRKRYSETFHTGPFSRAWSLSLCFKKIPDDDSDRYLAVSLNKSWASGDEKAIYVHFSVSVLDRKQQPSHTMKASKLYKLCGRHWFPNFIKRSTLLQQGKNFLPADTLTIRCSMRICDGASSSKVQHSFHSRSAAGVSDENLSACLRELLRSKRNSDVTVCATDREFRLHKPVLCARSTVFADFFDRYRSGLTNYTINIQGIRPEILELFFTFVYTGALEEGLTCETTPELFAAADHYKISDLKNLCSDFMMSNVCEILVSVSQKSDAKVKDMVRDFVCSNAEEVLVSDRWSELVRNYPHVASDILKSLALGYQEAKRRRVE